MIVLAGTSANNPSLTDPTLKNCFWNFVTGWQCEKVEPVQEQPPPSYSPEEPTNGNSFPAPLAMLPVVASEGRDCGCCGSSGGGSIVSPGFTSGPVTATTAKPCDDCGYTNKEAVMAMILGAIVLYLFSRQ
jgi:hypothetical protein